jgi:hypothetical protein
MDSGGKVAAWIPIWAEKRFGTMTKNAEKELQLVRKGRMG